MLTTKINLERDRALTGMILRECELVFFDHRLYPRRVRLFRLLVPPELVRVSVTIQRDLVDEGFVSQGFQRGAGQS